MRTYKTLKLLVVVGIFLMVLMEGASAGTPKANKTISIYVTVSEVTMVSISPDTLTWSGVSPGGRGTATAIQIENIGSTNITKVWFNASYPDSLPFGSSDFTMHNAGNYVVIKKNLSGSQYQWFYPNRVEYNESELIYLTLPAGYETHGRFRDAEHEYFWALKKQDLAGNCTNATFFIGVEPHNSTQDGTTDLSSCSLSLQQTGTTGCRSGALTRYDANWGYADVMIGQDGGGEIGLNYSIQVSEDCSHIFFYHWNQDMATAPYTSNDEDFYNSTIYPGGNVIANVNVHVPYGVPFGQKTGGLTVFIQAIDTS